MTTNNSIDSNVVFFFFLILDLKVVYCDAKGLLLSQNGTLFLHVWRRVRLALDLL